MSEYWAQRQRNTNRLVRRLAGHLMKKGDLEPRMIYGLSKLSWITNSFDADSAKYIRSTKIPALESLVNADFKSKSLREVAMHFAELFNDKSLLPLIENHTGYTNFYKAYRNSVYKWIAKNHKSLLPLYKAAYASENDKDRLEIIARIEKLPKIPKANHPADKMKPEYFLTPAFFSLDRKIRFPLINGNKGVQKLLARLDVSDSTLSSQYKALVKLYGQGGIADAADLDQLGSDSPDFLDTPKRMATRKLLKKKPTVGNELPLKDEADVVVIKQAGSVAQRRIHNQLTNKLRACLPKYTLEEGGSHDCMYDAMIKNYNGKADDLMIEVKSSIEISHVRMAVGQLLSYTFSLHGRKDQHFAVLLPERPAKNVVDFLKWMHIGLIWFSGDKLCTDDKYLCHLHNQGDR